MVQENELSHIEYNNLLFKRLVLIYDWVALFLLRLRRDMVGRINLPIHSKIIDIARGTGTQSIKFAKKGYQVVGVDISPDMISRARLKGGEFSKLSFEIDNAESINYPDSHFDIATLSFALHDMPDPMRQKVIQEMKRVTKSGGKIIIADYQKRSNQIARKLIYSITKIWESRYYEDFLDKGLYYYLVRESIIPYDRECYVFGEVETVFAHNKKF